MQLSKKFKIIDARSDPPKNQGNRGERLQNHGIHGYYFHVQYAYRQVIDNKSHFSCTVLIKPGFGEIITALYDT